VFLGHGKERTEAGWGLSSWPTSIWEDETHLTRSAGTQVTTAPALGRRNPVRLTPQADCLPHLISSHTIDADETEGDECLTKVRAGQTLPDHGRDMNQRSYEDEGGRFLWHFG
jgi:hypothetical protein